ncbi:DMT family transporter [Cypionkella sp.]|uniref:DMT family transporter n=1 Tax=Cypionkella sp. TaxID=2811411 RepID=UPI00263784FC|nr:DMT family transporter [Cypionkella sp.]MDB5664490.1 EamA/RhaT family transporter [Cypionkella sp.]
MPVAPSNLRGALLALAAFGIYATHDVLVKYLGASYSSFQLIFFSGLLGFPLVTIMLMSDRTDGNLIPKHPYWTALRTITAVLNGITGFYAFSVLPLAQCYAIFFAMPILITLLAIPILGEKVGLHRGMAIIAGLLGVMIVLRPGQEPLSLGHLSALAAAFLGAMTSVIVRKIGHDERSVVLMLYPMVANFVVMAVALPFVYVAVPVAHLGLMGTMAMLGLLGGLLTIAAYRSAPAIIVAPMQYSQIIWAIIYGFMIFGEKVDFWTAVGTTVIILAGVYIVLREDRPAVSKNRPVLETRSRFDFGAFPRIGLWLRLFDRRRLRNKIEGLSGTDGDA